MIILKRAFKKWDGNSWTGSIWIRIAARAGSCKFDNYPSGLVKRREFLD
jgi:hypothetical protein